MTMHSDRHPDDLRLSAYAAGDTDATSDRALATHFATCSRCKAILSDLNLLRGALADLPDLVPSRQLRLIPPVPAPAAPRSRPLEWVRRLAAPAMAAGAGLVLIGAVGASGLVGDISRDLRYAAAAASAGDTNEAGVPKSSTPTQPVPGGVGGANPSGGTDASAAPVRSLSWQEYASSSETPRSQTGGASPSPAPTADVAKDGSFGGLERSTEQPWLTLLIAGVALFAVSAVLRFSITAGGG
jgi:hypothetical protein